MRANCSGEWRWSWRALEQRAAYPFSSLGASLRAFLALLGAAVRSTPRLSPAVLAAEIREMTVTAGPSVVGLAVALNLPTVWVVSLLPNERSLGAVASWALATEVAPIAVALAVGIGSIPRWTHRTARSDRDTAACMAAAAIGSLSLYGVYIAVAYASVTLAATVLFRSDPLPFVHSLLHHVGPAAFAAAFARVALAGAAMAAIALHAGRSGGSRDANTSAALRRAAICVVTIAAWSWLPGALP